MQSGKRTTSTKKCLKIYSGWVLCTLNYPNTPLINSDRYKYLVRICVGSCSAATELYSLGWFKKILILRHASIFSVFFGSTIFRKRKFTSTSPTSITKKDLASMHAFFLYKKKIPTNKSWRSVADGGSINSGKAEPRVFERFCIVRVFKCDLNWLPFELGRQRMCRHAGSKHLLNFSGGAGKIVLLFARVTACCGDYALSNEYLHDNRNYFERLMYLLVIVSIFNVILLFTGFRGPFFSFFLSNSILGVVRAFCLSI